MNKAVTVIMSQNAVTVLQKQGLWKTDYVVNFYGTIFIQAYTKMDLVFMILFPIFHTRDGK